MIKLPSVFSDGALFQHNAVLAIRGHASAGVRAAAAVIKNGAAVSSAEADCGSDGRFEITVRTPAASFDTYSITISAGDDTVTLGNIMFGELWLASGQSNMELTNIFMTDCDEYLAALGGYKLRYFAQEYGDGTVFPYDGSDELGGRWSDSSDTAAMRQISAAGTAFMKQIYEYLNRCGDRIPVGILNASWGGTPIGGWIPRDELLADDEIRAVLEKTGRVPSPDNWNSYGDVNFQQMSAMYNRKIHPLLGVKIRGVIWYQGENDCGGEHVLNVYSRYLRLYRSVYKKLFACDRDRFMMISSLLYPWPYGESGETCMGYVNNAFIECAAEEPEAFAFAPIADLSPVWGYHLNNHPIHPTNKYEVGRRLGMLAETGCYGREGQSAPATLRSCAADGRRLILTFDNTGTGLRVEGRKARGLYICGADGIYLPAEYEIIAPDTLAVSYPFIEKPVHAAYAFNSFEPGCNLYAGDYPVAPFKTDWSRFIKIEAKPWMNMENDAVWVNSIRGDVLDMFYHSIWQPCSDSEICFDTAFTLEGRSLRIYSDNAGFGVSVKSYYGNRLALSDFAALRFNLLNCRGLSVSLICETGDREIEIEASRLHDVRGGWSTWEARLDALAGAEAGRMTFRFRHENNPYTFVNMESLYLVPKKLS